MVVIFVYLINEIAWQIVCITELGMKQNHRFTVYLYSRYVRVTCLESLKFIVHSKLHVM